MSRPGILLLGGTADARQLADRLAGLPVDLIVSLAGATRRPARMPGVLRTGGFGGADGLVRLLRESDIALLIDATHPFAAGISANAAVASARTGCPVLTLRRPPWKETCGDSWTHVPDLPAAIAALPDGACALMATGTGSALDLGARTDVRMLLRSIEPVAALPPHVEPLLARPPFSIDAETRLMRDRGTTHLVTRNAGGDGTAKLRAAADLGVQVLMIDRPDVLETGIVVSDVPQALERVRRMLRLDTPSGDAP